MTYQPDFTLVRSDNTGAIMSEFNRQKNDIERDFDFDTMMALARNNPEQFERVRLDIINDFIQSLPPERQHRMECLQWRIDRTREQSSNPLASCMAITEMMWESFERLNTLFMEMKNADSDCASSATLETADILPFQTA